MKKHFFLFGILSPVLAFFLLGAKIYYDIQLWRYRGEDKIFEITSGEGLVGINKRLYRQELIKSTRLFYRYVQYNDLMMKFKKGTYKITSGMNMIEIVELLTLGQSINVKVTIPEGKNLYQIAEILKNKGVISNAKAFISLCHDTSFLKKLGIKGPNCEGYLFPNTYRFEPLSREKDVIKRLYTAFKKYIEGIEFPHTNLTPYEVIILASIVEKETGAPWERPIIAGVFHNRLKSGMRLQSDPTTIYGIWKTYKGNLKRHHLRETTPYNTYKISGLPIGPISNPGSASITAVINPQTHTYLYFVSQNDGTHVFSNNYKEHMRAVKKYQKQRSARKGKSWRDLNKKINP